MLSAICFNLDQSKISSSGNELVIQKCEQVKATTCLEQFGLYYNNVESVFFFNMDYHL